MFMGVTSHHKLPAVSSYAAAQEALAAFKPSQHKVVAVGEQTDQSIAFTLYATDVVTWHPDDSVDIQNYGTITTSEFARRFLPMGIYLDIVTARRGVEGGHRTITYHTVGGDDWRARWGCARICIGRNVRFRARDGAWYPDEDSCDTMVFPELDRKRSRALGKRFHLADFENWLSMAPHHLTIVHEGWDLDACAAALEQRDFRTAAMFLPTMPLPRGFGAAGRMRPLRIIARLDEPITPGSLNKLRLALWDREDLLHEHAAKTLPLAEFNRRMTRVRALEALDICVGEYGPQ